jgi:hypothetical protein
MPIGQRQLYRSGNGDTWFLAREPATGSVFVRHEANPASGGQVTDMDLGAFLGTGEQHPEHEALIRLIGALIKSNQKTVRCALVFGPFRWFGATPLLSSRRRPGIQFCHRHLWYRPFDITQSLTTLSNESDY